MAHPCGDPNRATQCRAQSVAANSRRIGDVAPKSRYTTPNQGFAPFSGPPCRTFLSFPAERGRGGLVEGIAALLGSDNGSHYRGVSQLQSHQLRYSVQLRLGTPLRDDRPFGLPSPQHLYEIISENLRNCSCIKQIIPQFLKAANAY